MTIVETFSNTLNKASATASSVDAATEELKKGITLIVVGVWAIVVILIWKR